MSFTSLLAESVCQGVNNVCDYIGDKSNSPAVRAFPFVGAGAVGTITGFRMLYDIATLETNHTSAKEWIIGSGLMILALVIQNAADPGMSLKEAFGMKWETNDSRPSPD